MDEEDEEDEEDDEDVDEDEDEDELLIGETDERRKLFDDFVSTIELSAISSGNETFEAEHIKLR